METEPTKKSDPSLLKIIGVVMLIVVGIAAWYIAIPLFVIWYLYKKNKSFSPKTKVLISIAVSVIFVSTGLFNMHRNRAPVISVSEPENNYSIQADKVLVKGNVNPSYSAFNINGIPIELDKDGNFSKEIRLKDENNTLAMHADNSGNGTDVSLAVKRIFTEEEIAAKKKAEEEAQAKAKAELDKYYATPAGRICKAHPEWTKSDCEGLANGKIWIGMSYEMLKYRWGQPDSINPSNYGSGIKYQYCWHDYNPSCFYDRNDDGLIDSYN